MKAARGAARKFPGGWLAIAVTARGLRACSFFHPTRTAARTALAQAPALRGFDLSFDHDPSVPWSAPWFEALAAHFAGERAPIEVDLSGSSDFAQRVYRAARRIHPGQTMSYGELARRIGRPGAARAVGRALAANPVAPVVPCHRVVARNGALTGYSGPGGLRAKARLLESETRSR